MPPLLMQIKQLEEQQALPLFKTLLAGRLYYVKADKRLIQMQKKGKERHYFSLETDQPLSELSKNQVKKVKLNNAVRRLLKSTIAELELNHPDPELRQAAIESLLKNLDSKLIAQLEQRRSLETQEKIRELIQVALNLFQLKTNPSPAKQIEAIEKLADRLEIPVKNQLTQVAENSNHPEVKQAAIRALTCLYRSCHHLWCHGSDQHGPRGNDHARGLHHLCGAVTHAKPYRLFTLGRHPSGLHGVWFNGSHYRKRGNSSFAWPPS